MLFNSYFTTHPLFRSNGAFGDLDLLRRQMDALFNQELSKPGAALSAGWPRANLLDAGDRWELSLAVPGVKAEDLEIKFSDHEMTVKGERKTDLPEGYTLRRGERRPVRFMRQFRLPDQVSFDQVSARLEDGVLTITLPRKPEHKPRTIAIQS